MVGTILQRASASLDPQTNSTPHIQNEIVAYIAPDSLQDISLVEVPNFTQSYKAGIADILCTICQDQLDPSSDLMQVKNFGTAFAKKVFCNP